MKKISLLAALFVVPFAWGSETVRAPNPGGLPAGAGGGPQLVGGCPYAVADATIDGFDVDTGKIFFTTEKGKSAWLAADRETRFRIPGVDRKASKIDRLEAGQPAKLRYCTDNGKLLSVKVARNKTS